MTNRDDWQAAFDASTLRDADFETMSGVPVDASDKDQIRIAYSIGGGEVYRLVAAQSVRLSEVTGATSELVVDAEETFEAFGQSAS